MISGISGNCYMICFQEQKKWCTHAGAGHWPDADMLPVGPIRQVYDVNNWTNFTQE